MTDDGFSEIDLDEAQRRSIGGNNPPSGLMPPGDDLDRMLTEMHGKLFDRAKKLIEAEARMPAVIETEAQDQAATQYVKQIQACESELDAQRMAAKADYSLAHDQIHGRFRQIQDKLVRPDKKSPAALKERVQEKQTSYKVELETRARKAAEAAAKKAREAAEMVRLGAILSAIVPLAEAQEATRRAEEIAAKAKGPVTTAMATAAAEAADQAQARARDAIEATASKVAEAEAMETNTARAAAAPASAFTQSRGRAGGLSSLRTYWDLRNVDRAKIDLEALRPYFTTDALEKAARAYLNANKTTIENEAGTDGINTTTVPGVEFFKNRNTVGR